MSSPARSVATPSRIAQESPSRQLLQELSQLAISTQEGFYAQLDRDNQTQVGLHKKALAMAADRHDRVRQSVERERRRLETQVFAEKQRREEEQQREYEEEQRKLRLETAEKDLAQTRARIEEQSRLSSLQEAKRTVLRKAESKEQDRKKISKEDEIREKWATLQAAKRRAEEERIDGAKPHSSMAPIAIHEQNSVRAKPPAIIDSTTPTSTLQFVNQQTSRIPNSLPSVSGAESRNAAAPSTVTGTNTNIQHLAGQIPEPKPSATTSSAKSGLPEVGTKFSTSFLPTSDFANSTTSIKSESSVLPIPTQKMDIVQPGFPILHTGGGLTKVTTTKTQTLTSGREDEHKAYLVVHHQLKNLRETMSAQASSHPERKKAMGDMRREMKKCVGQLTGEKGANRQSLASIIHILRKAKSTSEPLVKTSDFFATPPVALQDPKDSCFQTPALFIYLLNIFSKAVISQFIDEAGVSPSAADPVGIITSHIFCFPEFRIHDRSLIDILLAKFHLVCPILFGISRSSLPILRATSLDTTPDETEVKMLLGWWREDSRTEGPFIEQQRHFERMTGLGAGFAAISLRNYEKSRNANPFPDHNYWRSLAGMANLPGAELTPSHFIVMKAMIENYEEKFIGFYGSAAVALLRLVICQLPDRMSTVTAAARSLAGLKDVIRTDKRLVL